MHYFSMQYYFNLRYPIVLLLDQGEIVKFVYNWPTDWRARTGGGQIKSRTTSKKARAAPEKQPH